MATVRIITRFFFERMTEKSLQVTPEGKKTARASLTSLGMTQKDLSNRRGISLSTISKFFNCKPVDRILFVQICETLNLDWQAISTEETAETRETQQTEEIDAIVQTVRAEVRSLIHEQCGTMRVLDMTQPIELTGDHGIYTNVNILERLTGRRRLEIEQLLRSSTIDEFERAGLNRRIGEPVLGLEAVKQHKKLMVLGKPGAGKTTFLKYLAMACIEGVEFSDRIPIFITLKRFAELDERPDLESYIRSIVKTEHSEQLLDQGRLLILLDGLDEVREEDTQRTISQIEKFSSEYPKNHFVMTCRIASKEYTFEKFTEVEVADFDNEQIATFVLNWFRCKDPEFAEERSTKLLENLNCNEPIKELASNPLLLTLICLECEESLEFPKNRAELYDRGLRVLLTKWDASRRIDRDQIYKKLSLKRKEDLLSQIALTTFTNKDYFIKQRILEGYIANYIRNLPDVATDPEALQVDSEAVLKSIESQHGLLVERARNIYSFSHLTFQEFFTARQIKESRSDELLQQVAKQVSEKRWREVFRLTVEMLPDADQFLLLMKGEVDRILAGDEKLQKFLIWVMQKSATINIPYKPGSIRAFYFTYGSKVGIAYGIEPSRSVNPLPCEPSLARLIDSSFNTFNSTFTHFLASGLALDTVCAFTEIAFSNNFLNGFSMLEVVSNSITFTNKNEVAEEVLKLQMRLPILDGENHIRPFSQIIHQTFKWYEFSSTLWLKKLRSVMLKYRNVGHDWQFNDAQKAKLQQYYDANKLLVDCLKSDCYVSRDVRQEIEETLLLPIAEIEKRSRK